tara:strand:+ start:125 stop:601 length:477 start_codon:yes stop_codon:yes gene_type:complete
VSKQRHKVIPAVYLFLIRDDQILLLQRHNTGFMDDWYSLPAGHLDGQETARHGLAREAFEEIGITIKPEDLELRLTMHNIFPTRESVDWFFSPKHYEGTISNKEPNKCSDLKFYPLNDLPNNIIPYIKQAIDCFKADINYGEWGWDDLETNKGFSLIS